MCDLYYEEKQRHVNFSVLTMPTDYTYDSGDPDQCFLLGKCFALVYSFDHSYHLLRCLHISELAIFRVNNDTYIQEFIRRRE